MMIERIDDATVAALTDPLKSRIELDSKPPAPPRMSPRHGEPIPMILTCPACNGRHIDVGGFATVPHRDHACQHCGLVWRPALVNTVGVQFLPGYKND